ncbi:hypothetical protein DPMN_000479 [Dreissena polymorpha]|uniref:Uncharacterized protein n=1 Tax=Dreissena polymorpha TaxID=45954 RepID=A0A9D4RS47_DREPO|nr:hypothetical protein DPMN_000479 [Dreissena polymorpha]
MAEAGALLEERPLNVEVRVDVSQHANPLFLQRGYRVVQVWNREKHNYYRGTSDMIGTH